jgi:hypothetical protein
LHTNGDPPAVISRKRRGLNDVPDFSRPAMHEFCTQLDGKRRQRIVNGEDTAADALARLETYYGTAGAVEFAEGGKSGGAGANNCYFAVQRHAEVSLA